MTAVHLLALSTPAVIGAGLLTLAYWVRTQNRSPILSSGGAETHQTARTTLAAGIGPPASASPSDAFDVASELAEGIVIYARGSAAESQTKHREDLAKPREGWTEVAVRAEQTRPTGNPGPIIDPARLAEIERMLAPSNLTFAGAERTLADAEKAIADLQRLFSRAKIAAGIVRTK